MSHPTPAAHKRPIAVADLFAGVVNEDSTTPVVLDVMANDKGGAALWAIDASTSGLGLLGLLWRDAPGATEHSALGARIGITAGGKVSYQLTDTLRAKLQPLHAGQSAWDCFSYLVRGVNGLFAWASARVELQGRDEGATLKVTATGSLTEDGTLTAAGSVTVTDPDAGESRALNAAGSSALGSWTITDAAWRYTASNAAAQHLAAGATGTDSFTVRSADGSASQVVVVTITGANDVAAIAGTASGTVTEDAALAAAGTLSVSDADDGEAQASPAAGATAYGSYTVDSSGCWSYLLDNAAAQSLSGSQVVSDSFTVLSADGTASQAVSITILGHDDPAAIGGTTTGAVQEDGTLQATGALTIADADAGQSTFQPQRAAPGQFGTFALTAEGAWTYTLSNAEAVVQALAGADVVQDSFIARAFDGAAQTVTIAITGQDDLLGDNGGPRDIGFRLTQAGNSLNPSGFFTASDPDGHTLVWSLAQTGPGGFMLDAATGALHGGGEGLSTLVVRAEDDAAQVRETTFNAWIGTNAGDIFAFAPSATNNIAFGQNGSDVITGSDGEDVLAGGGSLDRLLGLKGADFLAGGTGGFDMDEFRYRNASDSNALDGIDTVLDFNVAADTLAFHAALALGAVVGDITPMGGGSLLAGQVGWTQAGADTTVFANTGGTLMQILLRGVNTLSAGNVNTAASF